MITIKNLNKYYKSGQGTYHALRNINLTLPDQGLVFVVGKSGSGKSTLLNIIGGLDNYDSGELWIDDINTQSFKKSDYNSYRNTYIGFIFQEFNVIKSLSVYDNVALALELQCQSVKSNHEKILEIIDKVGLKGKEKRRMNEISGGEKQRVAIARALVKNPKVIIADEPTGNLDSKNRDIIMGILKDLSKDHLVLIVTHDKKMASNYGDVFVTIKDGEIINNEVTHPENIFTYTDTIYHVDPISPKAKVSFSLAWKAFIRNKFRFIFIIALFTFSLIFAGSVVNLYFANPSKEYAKYQTEYDNNYILVSQQYNSLGVSTNSALFKYGLDTYKKDYTTTEEMPGMTSYTSMSFDIPINTNQIPESRYYKQSIEQINIFNSNHDFQFLRRDVDEPRGGAYWCYITDYVASSLINYGYFDGNRNLEINDVIGKFLKTEQLKVEIEIRNIIRTDYESFLTKDFNDSKIYASFQDNLPFYNALFVTENQYSILAGYESADSYIFNYAFDDIIFNALNQSGTFDNVKIMPFDNSLPFATITDEDGTIVQCGEAPKAPLPQQLTQIAVSRGYFEKVLKLDYRSYTFAYNGAAENYILLNEYGNPANFYNCGYRRVPAAFNSYVTGIIDSDECIIYMPAVNEHTLFDSYINSSFVDGGFLLMKINENEEVNAEFYKKMLDQNLLINNISFKKLLIVDQFVKDNLIIFVGLFFIFCLFSVLLIFNFIIINIKNSTKDIGIFMSLGMNGWKISLIYLFQVLIISTIATVISLIGSAIFLVVLDSIFSSQALIDFSVIKFTLIGALVTMLIAYITPTLAIIFPLFRLSSKKPIDIIKVS